jgi:hypothetical protein
MNSEVKNSGPEDPAWSSLRRGDMGEYVTRSVQVSGEMEISGFSVRVSVFRLGLLYFFSLTPET